MMLRIHLFIILVFLCGCNAQTENSEIANKQDPIGINELPNSPIGVNELANKHVYSIIQVYEYKYREVKNDIPYMIFKKALDSDATVVAFPIKNASKGYVVILAKSEKAPFVKVLPEVDFVVTREAYIEVKNQVDMSEDVDVFISAHINEGLTSKD